MTASLSFDTSRWIKFGQLLGLMLSMTACGGGSGTSPPTLPPTSYLVGGSVTGLIGTVVVQNNGVEDLSLAASGPFSFATPIAQSGAYAVTVLTQPSGQTCAVANASGSATAAVADILISCTATPPIALYAGNMSGYGHIDGTGAAVRFASPQGLATDSVGNVYVADIQDWTIRKLTPAGEVSTLAGLAFIFGQDDGSGTAARFRQPAGVATDRAGNVYVADQSNHTIRRITPAGTVSTLAGFARRTGNADGSGAAALFNLPTAVATDSAGNIYVADTLNHTIRKITPSGDVSTVAGSAGLVGSADGSGAGARFNQPGGVATDSAGNIYVADVANQTIRKITPAGSVSTLAGSPGLTGSADGSGAAARFNFPFGLATDSTGNIYVADGSNQTIRKITPAGTVTTLAGSAGRIGNVDGTGEAARFRGPTSVATDSAGNVYVADKGNGTIRKITPAGVVVTLAGQTPVGGSADGSGANARFADPKGMAADSAGNIYVADDGNSTIRKITPAGTVSTLAGLAGRQGNADGSGSEARFLLPTGVATDSGGNVFVADTTNQTIRKITPAGVVTTLAGSASASGGPGLNGSADGSGSAARFNGPVGVATDRAGNVYVADRFNHTIRKITPTGNVSTLAGSPGLTGSADGSGAAARFNFPFGLATDSADNIYVANSSNQTIRKITPAGTVSTLAGFAEVIGSADGTGAAARFTQPSGVATDSAGNIYVADNFNHLVRKITPAGDVSTVVGARNQAGFVSGPLPGLLSFPIGVAMSGKSLYISMANGVAVVQRVP